MPKIISTSNLPISIYSVCVCVLSPTYNSQCQNCPIVLLLVRFFHTINVIGVWGIWNEQEKMADIHLQQEDSWSHPPPPQQGKFFNGKKLYPISLSYDYSNTTSDLSMSFRMTLVWMGLKVQRASGSLLECPLLFRFTWQVYDWIWSGNAWTENWEILGKNKSLWNARIVRSKNILHDKNLRFCLS